MLHQVRQTDLCCAKRNLFGSLVGLPDGSQEFLESRVASVLNRLHKGFRRNLLTTAGKRLRSLPSDLRRRY
jgi:hypothetical protein